MKYGLDHSPPPSRMSRASSVTSDGSFEIVSVINELPQDWDAAMYKPMVTFHDLFDVYPMDTDIIVRISFEEKFKRSPSDKVIVLPICWKTTEQALCAVNVIGNYVRFDVNDLPKSYAEDTFYQLCYCSENEKVVGVSIPFSVREVHEDELMEYQKEQNKEFWSFRSRFAVLMDVYWNSLSKKLSKEIINSNSNSTDGTFQTPTQSETDVYQNNVQETERVENQSDIETAVEVNENDVKEEKADINEILVREEADVNQILVEKEADVNQNLVKEEDIDTNQQIQSIENTENKEDYDEVARKLEILNLKYEVQIEGQKELQKLCKIYFEERKELLSFLKRFEEYMPHIFTKPVSVWWEFIIQKIDDICREENLAIDTFELKALVEQEAIKKKEFHIGLKELGDILLEAEASIKVPKNNGEHQESQATQTCESVLCTPINKENLYRLKQEESRIYHENKTNRLLKEDELFNPSNLISDLNYNKMMKSLMSCGYHSLTRSDRLWDNINEMFSKFHSEFEQLFDDKVCMCRERAWLYQTKGAAEEANKALRTRLVRGAKEYAKLMLKHQELIKKYGDLKKETN